MVIPLSELEYDGVHVRMFIDNANEAVIFTIVTDEAINEPEIMKI